MSNDHTTTSVKYSVCLFNTTHHDAAIAEEFPSYEEAEKYAKKTLVGEGVLSDIEKITIRKNEGGLSVLLHEIDVISYPA